MMENKIKKLFPCTIRNLQLNFEQNVIFKNLNFVISESPITVLTGNNGTGKTLLLKILAGIINPTSGSITFNNENLKNNDFSFIFQKPIFLDRTVYDNLLYVLKVKNKMKRADEVINKNAQEYKITHLLYRSTRGLSGGEQQIISFIRALIVSAKVIFLDEAFSNLDKLYIDKIEFIINQISKNGIKIIMISHDDNQILRLANQVFNIKDGAIDEKI